MTTESVPDRLGVGGRELWVAVTEAHDLDRVQLVQLEEACRAKDRLDKFDLLLSGDVDSWARLVHRARTEDYELVVDDALGKANATANLMKQLLAALRLPDEAGRRPQRRGGARGSYKSSGKVSSLDRARQARSG